MTGFAELANSHMEPLWQVLSNLGRIGLAAILGGCVGMERELKRKAAGLRTNMFICLGSALFTILSGQLAAHVGGDHTRIAAQIIPGIGFIGAGCILHSRGSVQGLTTAATIFVVASIGIAAGGGFYLTAILTTVMVLLFLLVLGSLEERFMLKPSPMTYEAFGEDSESLLTEINQALEELHEEMEAVHLSGANKNYRLQFVVSGTRGEQRDLLARLRTLSSVTHVQAFVAPDRE